MRLFINIFKTFLKIGFNIFICCLYVFPSYIHAQVESISLFETTDLPTTNITRVRQDKKGFIWFTSEEGLFRFDGYTYEQHAFLNNNHDFPLGSIKKIEFDDYGRIWLDTKDNKLYAYEIETKKLHRIKFVEESNYSGVNSMTICNDKLFIGHKKPHYFSLKNLDYNKIKLIPIGDKIFTRLGYARNNVVWFVMSDYMIMFDAKSETLLRTIKMPTKAISICVDNKGNVWIVDGSDKIYKYNTASDEWKIYDTKVNEIKWLEFDEKNNKVIITAITDLYNIDLSKEEVILQKISSQKKITNARETFIDRQNNLWLVTSGDLLKINFNKLNINEVYIENSKRIIAEDLEGYIWLGEPNSGLTRNIIGNKGKVKNYLPEKEVCYINKQHDSLFYVFTKNEIYEMKFNVAKNDFKVNKKVTKIINYINSGICTKENIFWIGNSKGITRINTQKKKTKQSFALKRGNVSYLIYDEIHHVILASVINKGVYQLSLNDKHEVIKVKNINQSKGLGSNTVQSIYITSKNAWVATSRGLSKLKFNKNKGDYEIQKNYTTEHGLTSNYIMSMVAQNDSILWVGTAFGINKYNSKNNIFTNYYKGFGTLSNKITNNFSIYSKDKKIYFGTNKGFLIFDAELISPSPYQYEIYIENIKINGVGGKKVRALKDLQHYENFLSFTISVPNYISPNAIKYQYKLDDKDWVTSPARLKMFNIDKLSYGAHKIDFMCSNEDGVWNSKIKTIRIYINPPFWLSWWFITMVILMVIIIFRILMVRFKIRKEFDIQLGIEKRLRETDQEKIKFFTNVSHDLKTPLTMINSPIEKMLNQKIPDAEQKYLLETASRNTNRLINLINQVLNFSTIKSGDLTLNIQKVELISFLNNIITSFNFEASKNEIELSLVSDLNELTLFFDKEKIERVLYNLLSNAFKNTSKNGKIYLNVFYDPIQSTVSIEIEDTGIGIKKDKLNSIFKRFYQADNENVGEGIGLSIVKEYIDAHDGSVSVESEFKKGTKITVLLPVEEKNNHEIDSVLKQESDNKYTILVVEDNDELRKYISYELKPYYKIEIAANGKEAMEIAKAKSPNLILTDLMMPKMNGVELCDLLKNDIKTSHIPVIIITASSGMEMESLAIGANDYIAKPLNIDRLLLKIKNQINTLELVKEKFDREIRLTPKEDQTESPQKVFINKIMGVIEEEFIHEKLNIELLTSKMNMSKSVLYKKVLEYTGQSVNELITTIKIKKAEELLLNSNHSFNEITYILGYNDSKHFRSLFKKKNGVTPLQFKKIEKASNNRK